LKLFLIQMKTATGKDIAENIIGPVKVIPASLLLANYTLLLISTPRHRRHLIEINEWWMKKQVGKRVIVGLM
jgi:hypothetical protein